MTDRRMKAVFALVFAAGLGAEGFPQGKVGRMLQAVYEFKLNGLESLFDPLR